MNRRLLVKSDSNSSVVIIRKAKLSDGGDYSCMASNLVGRRESAIVKLIVYGKFTTCMEQNRIICITTVKLNVSTMATLGTEESGRCKDVAVMGR